MLPQPFAELLADDVAAFEARPGIWSVLGECNETQPYDGRARLYDTLIGNRLYNFIAWGAAPSDYANFARQAAEFGDGCFLDAGCGTCVSTAQVHATSQRPTVLLDLSLDMLEAARSRIVRLSGSVPSNLLFLQGDLCQLPFKDRSFGSVLSPGVLHIFEDVEDLTCQLARVTASGARIFASSLVAERWISARYLNVLYKAGEVARPRRLSALVDRLNAPASGLNTPVTTTLMGSMAFITAQPV